MAEEIHRFRTPDGKIHRYRADSYEKALAAHKRRISMERATETPTPAIGPDVPGTSATATETPTTPRDAGSEPPVDTSLVSAIHSGALNALTFNRFDDLLRVLGDKEGARRYEMYSEQSGEKHPIGQFMGEVTGAGLTGGAIGAALKRFAPALVSRLLPGGQNALDRARRVATYTGMGGAEAAAHASGRTGATKEDVLTAGGIGAITGGATGAFGDVIAGRMGRKAARERMSKTPDMYEKIRRPYYDRAKEAIIKPRTVDYIIDEITSRTKVMSPDGQTTRLLASEIDTSMPHAKSFMDKMRGYRTNVATYGKTAPERVQHKSLEDLVELTQAADEFIGKSEGVEREFIIATKKRIDRAIASLNDDSFLTPGGRQAVEGIIGVKKLDNAKRKVEVFERIRNKLDKSVHKGDVWEFIEDELTDIINSPTKSGVFSEQELANIKRARDTTWGRQILRNVAELSPTNQKGFLAQLGLQSAGGVSGNLILNTIGAILAGGGAGSKMALNRGMRNELDDLIRMISTGASKDKLMRRMPAPKGPAISSSIVGAQTGDTYAD